MEFLYFLVIVIIGMVIHRKLRSRIDYLSKELAALRVEIASLKNTNASHTGKQQLSQVADQLTSEITEQTFPGHKVVTQQSVAKAYPPAPSYPKRAYEKKPRKGFKGSEFWKNFEAQFAGNVTGIVGTLAVILGVVFLGVYAAIQLDPLGRFGVVCLFSVALYILYFFLNKKTFWRDISLWIRSASGVIFLMGCLGSVGFEAMKWVDVPWMCLGLLCLGLAANLTLGFLNGGEIFASTHVIFSLLALSLVPVSPTTFSIASLVTFIGIVMSSKDRHWDRHIIATTLGFSLLHFYWLYHFKSNGQEFSVNSVQAILLCLTVGAAGIITHYRKTYQTSDIQCIPLLAHIITWVTLGLNLYAHAKGSIWSTVFLALATIIAFVMSTQARRFSIPWLYVCDRLVSLLLALIATISLCKFGLSGYEISIISAIVATIFLRIASQTFEKTVFKISNIILLAVYGAVTIHALILIGESKPVETSSLPMLLCSFFVLAFVFPNIQKKAAENQLGFSFSYGPKNYVATFIEIPFALHGFLAFLLAIKGKTNEWLLLFPIGIAVCEVFLRERLKNLLFDFSVLVSTASSVAVCTLLILGDNNSMQSDAILCVGLLLVGGIGFKFCWSEYFKQKVTWPGVGVVWLTVTATIYSFTKDISPVLPGMAWLLVSLVASELKEYKKLISESSAKHSRTDLFIGLLGLVSLALFITRYFLVDISNEALVFGFLRIRVFSELLSLGTLIYWMAFSKNSRHSLIKTLTDYLLEVFLALSVVYVLYEVNSYQHPVVWSISSFACYFLGKKIKEFDRLILYSYWFYFGSLFHIAFLSTTIAIPSPLLLDQAWLMGLVSVCISTAFMVIAHKDRKSLIASELTLPRAVGKLAGFKSLADKFEVKILLYPLFAAIGLFLFWSFDKTILSLLWVIECFILFSISILMREPQFRIVSMVGIGLIILRIVFYDLTGRDFFIKAVVFISVGAILIAMNTIYNKYKYRYESKQQ